MIFSTTGGILKAVQDIPLAVSPGVEVWECQNLEEDM
jgi:hypothetical protein